MVENNTFADYFSDLSDPRSENRSHPLLSIIIITVCAIVCGAEGWEDIEEYRFVESTQPANWSGWNVQFQNEERQVSLCGRNGVQIVTKDGEKLFIGSRKLDVLREKIKNHLAPSE